MRSLNKLLINEINLDVAQDEQGHSQTTFMQIFAKKKLFLKN